MHEAVSLAGTLFAIASGSALAASDLAAKYLWDDVAGTDLRPPCKAALGSRGDSLDGWEA